MTDPAGPYSRPSSSAAAYAAQASMPPPSPRPSVTSRGSISSLRRQAAIAASASISPPTQQQPPQQLVLPNPDQPPEPSQPKLTQLFTTLTSTSNPSNRTSTHYPTVHYIFADDDPDILTEALARHHRTDPDDDQSPPLDRAILLELAPSPSGYEVIWASSLAPDWAVVDARISRMDSSAGTLQGNPSAGSLVLEIDGVSVEAAAAAPSPVPGGAARQQSLSEEYAADPGEGYPALVDEFEKGMGVYRRVVEAAEARRRALEAAGEHGEEGEEETQMPEEETQRPDEEYDVKGKAKAVYESVDEEDEGGPHTG